MRSCRGFLFLLLAVLVGTAACGVNQISPLFSFDVRQSFSVIEPSADSAGRTVSFRFIAQMEHALDSNGTSPSLVTGAKVSRALLLSSAHDLTRFKNLQLFLSSDSLAEVLVGQLASLPKSDSAVLDLTPNFIQLSRAFSDSTIHLRLAGTLLTSPIALDTLTLRPTFSFVAEPVSPP